jgi:hypothetical protein
LIRPDPHASLIAMPPRKQTQLDLFEQIAAMDERLEPMIGYTPGELVQCAFPQIKPRGDRRVWLRRNGDLTVKLESGTNDDETPVGLPYGPKARVFIALCAKRIKQTGSATVELGASQNAFMDSMGYLSKSGGTTGNKGIVAEQARRIVRAKLEVRWPKDHPNRDRAGAMPFAEFWDLWWDRGKNPTHPVDGSYIVFSSLFVRMVERAKPVNLEAMVILGKSALAQDLYTFLSGRLYQLRRPLKLNKVQLAAQFGNGPMPEDPGKLSDFISETWRNIRGQLPAVMKVYHEANVEVLDDGLLLRESPAHVPPTGAHAITRARRSETKDLRRLAAIVEDRQASGQLILPTGTAA